MAVRTGPTDVVEIDAVWQLGEAEDVVTLAVDLIGCCAVAMVPVTWSFQLSIKPGRPFPARLE
jgi:hypothetical protein